MRRVPRAALVGSALLILAACSQQIEPGQFSSEQIMELAEQEANLGNSTQVAILQDGIVTAEEYESAFQQVRSCYQAFGYTVSDPVVSPINGVRYEYTINAEGFDRDQVWENLEACEGEFWTSVSLSYEGSRTHRMDGSLWAAAKECLGPAGISIDDTPGSLQEFVEVSTGGQQDTLDCVSAAATELFPELQTISLQY